MSDTEEEETCFNVTTSDEKLEISSLHSSLLVDVEWQLLVDGSRSVPTSPSRLAFRESSLIRTTSASAPTSPTSLSSIVPRAYSVRSLISHFETTAPSIMADEAKLESKDQARKISAAKVWITRRLKQLETMRIATNGKLDPFKFQSLAEQIQKQSDTILALTRSLPYWPSVPSLRIPSYSRTFIIE